MDQNAKYRKRLNELIPGGAHTYSRGDDQYPENAPALLVRGQGSHVWDADGNRFLDYGMALRAVTAGYAHKGIADAAIREIRYGNNLTRASLTELKAAETIVDLVPCAEMVKFAKNGSTVTTAAVKLARAYTGRKYVAFCAQHPFFSYDDWFIGATPIERGIPGEMHKLSVKFDYNDIASLEKLFSAHKGEIACVIMEPATTEEPRDNFLQKVQKLCNKNGAVFILDEMITGFRWDLRGAQHYYKVRPDLATFGKGMANGFSVAALVGKKEIMNLGGILKEGSERVFLISTTHGAEMCGLGAFTKTVEVYKKENVIPRMWSYGKKLIKGMNDAAAKCGVKDQFSAGGFPCSPFYVTKDLAGAPSLALRTLFSQELIKHGVLMPWIALSSAHTEADLDVTLAAVEKALTVYALALENGPGRYLKGKAIRPVFRKYN